MNKTKILCLIVSIVIVSSLRGSQSSSELEFKITGLVQKEINPQSLMLLFDEVNKAFYRDRIRETEEMIGEQQLYAKRLKQELSALKKKLFNYESMGRPLSGVNTVTIIELDSCYYVIYYTFVHEPHMSAHDKDNFVQIEGFGEDLVEPLDIRDRQVYY